MWPATTASSETFTTFAMNLSRENRPAIWLE
jgi:hypothetical protein